MRERAGLRRAAWRELWPTVVLAIALAGIVWAITLREGSPVEPWLLLVLGPAALYAGIAVGRCSPRTLAFLFARPCSRERLLVTRVEVGLAGLGGAVLLAAVPIVARSPEAPVLVELALACATLLLAFACAVVGALSSDREPLGLGVGILLFCALPSVLLWSVELAEITAARAIASHPYGLIAAIMLAVLGCARAVQRLWCEVLPVRDRAAVKRLLTDVAAGAVPGQILSGVLVFHSATASEAVPLALLGHDERGAIVAAGSPGGDVDVVLRGDEVLLDVDELGGIRPDVRSAVVHGELIALRVVQADETCEVVLLDPQQGVRRIPDRCGRLAFSPSGETLSILHDRVLTLVDLTSLDARRLDYCDGVAGWIGEDALTYDYRSRLTVAGRELWDLPASGASPSPDQRRVAFRRSPPEFFHGARLADKGPALIAVVPSEGGVPQFHILTLMEVAIVEWLDAEHLVVTGKRLDHRHVFAIVSASTGDIVAEAVIEAGLSITDLEGPVHGPWLATRRGALLEAIAPDGAQLWRETVATLERDSGDVRRWAIVDGEVIGIGRDGRWWRHAVPWEGSR